MAATRIAEKCFSNLFMDPDAVDEAERKDKMEKKERTVLKPQRHSAEEKTTFAAFRQHSTVSTNICLASGLTRG